MVEQELETIAFTVKDTSISFPLIGQKEKERKQLLAQLHSIEGSQKEATQPSPMLVYTLYQSQQSLYKDLSVPLTFPFSSTSPNQSFQPLAMTHFEHNPFKPSGILPSITYLSPLKVEPQTKPQNEPSFKKNDKEPLYQPPDPTIGASSKPPNMNMLAVDPDPPNPNSSFLKNLTLENPREHFVLPVVDVTDLDLSHLGLEEVFMVDNQPIVEEDDVLRPKSPPPLSPILPPPHFVPDTQTRLTHPSITDSKHFFIIDNAPPSKWHDEIFNMYSWCTVEL